MRVSIQPSGYVQFAESSGAFGSAARGAWWTSQHAPEISFLRTFLLTRVRKYLSLDT